MHWNGQMLETSIVESFELLARDSSDPLALADEFLSRIDSEYDLPLEEWLAVIDAIRTAVERHPAYRCR